VDAIRPLAITSLVKLALKRSGELRLDCCVPQRVARHESKARAGLAVDLFVCSWGVAHGFVGVTLFGKSGVLHLCPHLKRNLPNHPIFLLHFWQQWLGGLKYSVICGRVVLISCLPRW
jgi:hypothetical protein